MPVLTKSVSLSFISSSPGLLFKMPLKPLHEPLCFPRQGLEPDSSHPPLLPLTVLRAAPWAVVPSQAATSSTSVCSRKCGLRGLWLPHCWEPHRSDYKVSMCLSNSKGKAFVRDKAAPYIIKQNHTKLEHPDSQ